jgi:molybdopterin molybdotransferase
MSSALLSYDEAAALVSAHAQRLLERSPAVERVELGAAAGRVLAEPLRADRDLPPFPRSTRDGFACRAAEAASHSRLRVVGSIRAGEAPQGPLPAGAAWEIMTGAPVPQGADAVAMQGRKADRLIVVFIALPSGLVT